MGVLQKICSIKEKEDIINFLTKKEVPADMKGNVRNTFRKRAAKFCWSNNVLYLKSNGRYKRVFCTFEEEEKKDIIRVTHRLMHQGSKKIFKHLQTDYYGITRDLVEQIISACTECLVANPMTTKQPIRAIKTKHVRERFQIDCVDYKSYERYNDLFKFCVNIIDCYSKFIWAFPVKDKSMHTVVRILRNLFMEVGPPLYLHSDNGTEFKNSAVAELCENFHVKQIFGRPRYPQAQGQIERANQTLKRLLSRQNAFVDKKSGLRI